MKTQSPGQALRNARKSKKITLDELADRTGFSVSFISRMEAGKRNITMDGLKVLADAIGVQPSEIVANLDEINSDDAQPITAGMPVMGEVRAGMWLEVEGDSDPIGTIPALPDARYAGQRQYALKVVGTSMNLIARPGIYVVIADWADNGSEMKDGDLVVVRRERAHTYEVTLKRLKMGKKQWELWPESDDPKHQEPILLEAENPEWTVAVVGKVIGKYEPL